MVITTDMENYQFCIAGLLAYSVRQSQAPVINAAAIEPMQTVTYLLINICMFRMKFPTGFIYQNLPASRSFPTTAWLLFCGIVKKTERPKFWSGRVPTDPTTSTGHGLERARASYALPSQMYIMLRAI